MLQRIIKRARFIKATNPLPLNKFINQSGEKVSLDEFCYLDDHDVLAAIMGWCGHEDQVLSFLCKGIINRDLLKVKYFGEAVAADIVAQKKAEAIEKLDLSPEDAGWLVFTGEAVSSTYNFENEHIHILFKDGTVKDISEVDDALINQNLLGKIKKYYICYLR